MTRLIPLSIALAALLGACGESPPTPTPWTPPVTDDGTTATDVAAPTPDAGTSDAATPADATPPDVGMADVAAPDVPTVPDTAPEPDVVADTGGEENPGWDGTLPDALAGKAAPEFKPAPSVAGVVDSTGSAVMADQLTTDWTVIWFYPAAMTAG